jgi:hypothetical protein
MINKEVKPTQKGVQIQFQGGVEKGQIIKMVQNCATGSCECMSDATKQKIEAMEVTGEDGDVKLDLTGDIEVGEIEAALAKSKVVNPS